MNFEKAKYSINKGIWGTSVGGKETLTSGQNLPGDAFPTPVSKDGSEDITLHFEKGELKGINEEHFDKPTDAIRRLNAAKSEDSRVGKEGVRPCRVRGPA